jgi:hypothetical protein
MIYGFYQKGLPFGKSKNSVFAAAFAGVIHIFFHKYEGEQARLARGGGQPFPRAICLPILRA